MSSQSDVEEDDVVTEFYGPARLNDDSSVHQGTPFDNLTSQSLEPLDEEGTLHDDNMNEDIEALKNAWMNELNSPEILEFQDELISEMLEQVKNQQQFLDEAATSGENFLNNLYQMEIDRIKYMIASYLRIRLMKLEQHPLYYLKELEKRERLSDPEQQFLGQFVTLTEKHFEDVFLSKLPEQYQSLDAENMVETPDLDHFVVCETTEAVGRIQCDNQGLDHVNMNKGDRHVVRYRVIQPYLEQNKAKLI